MSDQYAPESAPRTPMPQTAYRDSAYANRPVNPALLAKPRSDDSGFATGLLVACVFVAVAILAATFYSPPAARPIDLSDSNSAPGAIVESDGEVLPTTPETTATAGDPVAADTAVPTGTNAADTNAPAADATGTDAAGSNAPANAPTVDAPAADPVAPAPAPVPDDGSDTAPQPVPPAAAPAAPATQP